MKGLLKDSWFQMFTAVAASAAVVSALGVVTASRSPEPAAPAAGSAPAAAAAPAAPAPVSAPAAGPITPAPRSSSELATYGSAVPPASQPPPPPPQMTLTGAGVGNTQGIVGVPAGGGVSGFLSGLLGGGARTQPAQTTVLPANRVLAARAGVFNVGPGTDADTPSLRDAVFSASSGDLIIVRPGSYDGPVEVLNKSLRIRGAGARPADVTVRWAGRGATISVRGGSLELERVRVERGTSFDFPKTEPGGAVYAVASTLLLRKVELDSADYAAPPLILEQGDRAARATVEDSKLSGSRANLLVRGPVKVKLARVSFEGFQLPLAAWIDAAVELEDCRFLGAEPVPAISAYEGARVTMTGRQKPRVNTARGAESTAIEDSFGVKRASIARGGFSRDIFRRGRRPGSLP